MQLRDKIIEDFWVQKLSGTLRYNLASGARQISAKLNKQRKIFSKELPLSTFDPVKDLIKNKSINEYKYFLGALYILIQKYTGLSEILVSTPVFKLDGIKDDQDHLLFLKAYVNPEMTVRSLIKQLHGEINNAYINNEFLLNAVLKRIKDKEMIREEDLYEVGILFEDFSKPSSENDKLNLFFEIRKQEQSYIIDLHYNSFLYTHKDCERIIEHFLRALNSMISSLETVLADIDLLSKTETEDICYNIARGKISDNTSLTLIDLFERQVQKAPNETALVFADTRLSYDALNEQVNHLAWHLIENCGIVKGDHVAILMNNSDKLLISVLAVLKSGAVYIPIDPEYPNNRIKYILRDSNPRILITESGFLMDLSDYTGSLFAADVEWPTIPATKNFKASKLTSDDVAYIIYTSGSTGTPKGVVVLHNSLVNYLTWASYYYFANIDEGNFGLFTSIAFDLTITSVFLPLIRGRVLKIIDNAKELDSILEDYFTEDPCMDAIKLTPSHLSVILAGAYNLKNLRTVILGGEALSPELVRALKNKNPALRIYNEYGPTEATVGCSAIEVVNEYQKNVPIGRPINNIYIYVLSPSGQLTPQGIPGEIYIGGRCLAEGYLNNEKLTRDKFVPDPFHNGERLYKSGDLGWWNEQGNLEYIGRLDHQVKLNGYRIELEEIESVLKLHPLVEDGAVILKKDVDNGNYLAAFISVSGNINSSDLRLHALSVLPEYMVPSHYIVLKEFPLTINGKIDRNSLETYATEYLLSSKEYIEPRNETEKKLLSLWKEILANDKISVKDDFFELGGHSLRATRLLSQIFKEFEIKLELNDLFNVSVLEDQAKLIEKGVKTVYSDISRVETKENYELSSAQKRLWVLSQYEGGNIAYNMPRLYTLRGKVSLEVLEKVFSTLIERHETLRTVFRRDKNNEVKQWIKKPEDSGFKLLFKDLSTNEKMEENLSLIIKKEKETEFNLLVGPLLKVSLYKVREDEYVFLFVVHHIISDGWSMEVLFREIISLYNAYAKKLPDPLLPINLQYKDYSAWQQNQLKGERLEEHRAYWHKQFEGELPVLELPLDKPRPQIKTYNGGVITRNLNPELTNQLKVIVQKHGCTIYMGLLSAVNVLLYRYTGQNDLIIGCPIAGREHADLENQIGFYLNTLALRTRFGNDDSFTGILNAVKKVTLDAYEHQAYPFDKLVDDINITSGIKRQALFDVLVVLQNTNLANNNSEVTLQDIEVYNYEKGERVLSLFDLTFNFIEVDNGIKAVIEYNSDIFSQTTIEKLGDNFNSLLERALTNPEIPVKELDYLEAPEKNILLTLLDNTKVTFPRNETLVTLFEKQVERTPGNIALVSGSIRISYEELNCKVNKLAHFLCEEISLLPEEPVGILINRNHYSVIAMLAALKAGGSYLPIDPSSPEDRFKFIVKDARLRIIISEKEFIEKLNRLQWLAPELENYICLDTSDIYNEKEIVDNPMMNKELWDHVGENAQDKITGGGWISSYTGEPIPEPEMEEYALNAYKKLEPFLNKDLKVLEVGCSSGLTLSKIAKKIKLYYGTDLSSVIINNTQKFIEEEGIKNIKLQCLPAHELLKVEERKFDIVILNSVIQHFHGHNYLRKVIESVIELMNDKGTIFIGDIMDTERKDNLINDLEEFKKSNRGKGITTKTDFSADLFVSKSFFNDLSVDFKSIRKITSSEKIHTIENELTKFRYDILLTIDKKNKAAAGIKKVKHQYDVRVVDDKPVHNPGIKINPNNLAYIIYTSGTTGRPKGVLVQHNNVVRLFFNDKQLFDFNSNDVWTMFHSHSFDFSVWEMYGAILFGGKLVVVPKFIAQDTSGFYELLIHEKVTVLNQTPSAFYNLSTFEKENSSQKLSLRYVIFGGEALNPLKLADWKLKNPSCKIVNMYGITETTVHVTFKEVTDKDIKTNCSNIGKPIPTLGCLILDDSKQLVPLGVPGELYVKGEGLARGYLNNAELTTERFIQNPFSHSEKLYRSGDKVRLLENGEMEYLGRVDSQVKVRGYRIELDEINNILLQYYKIKDAVVLTKNEEDETSLIAFMVSDEELTVTDIKGYLEGILPEYMIPSRFVQVNNIPLNPNGKMDKSRLMKLDSAAILTGTDYFAPVNQTETNLLAIWEEILGVTGISTRDDFFDLGGHSLKATRLVSHIYKTFGVKLDLRDLFNKTTIQEQSRLVGEKSSVDFETIQPVENKAYYEVSASQHRMWILSQFTEANLAYNMSGIYYLNGKLNTDVLAEAFNSLVNRHEVLRTVFIETESGLMQLIRQAKDYNFELQYTDLSDSSKALERAKKTIYKESNQEFDLEKGPLFKAHLLKIKDEEFIISFVIHHIISDGWSIGILLKELLYLYDALSKGNPNGLSPLRIQYKDYAAWQNKQLNENFIGDHKKYWLEVFEGPIPVLQFPLDKPRPKVKTYNGRKVTKHIDKKLIDSFKHGIREQNATLFMGLLSVVKILLFRYTQQTDIIIGSPIAGREHADLEDQIGVYINTLAFRTKFKTDDSYQLLLKNVKQVTLNAYANQIYPFDQLVDELNLARDISRNALFDVVVVLQNADINEEKIDALKLEGISVLDYGENINQTSKFDLTFSFSEAGGGLNLNLEYNTDLFNHDTIIRLAHNLEQLILSVTQTPEKSIPDLELLSEHERGLLLFEFGNGKEMKLEDEAFITLFHKTVLSKGNNIALVTNNGNITYTELNDKANQLAAYLNKYSDIEFEDIIGVSLEKNEWFIISLLAVLKTGAAFVPIDLSYPKERVKHILSDAGCKTHITSEFLDGFLKEQNLFSKQESKIVSKGHHLAYVIYTSGSTGKPKGVMIENKALLNLCKWHNHNFQITSEDKTAWYASVGFDASIWEIFPYLLCGASIAVIPADIRLDILSISRYYEQNNISVAFLPTHVGEQFLTIENRSLRMLLLGGDKLNYVEKKNYSVINNYGPTENTVVTTSYPVEKNKTNIPIGKPIYNTSLYILDAYLNLLPIGAVGEIYISGLSLARGYLNDGKLTQEQFIENPFEKGIKMYKTGDLGKWNNEGNIEFFGRNDEQVKVRGNRIELSEIEFALKSIDTVNQAMVSLKTDVAENTSIIAYLTVKSEANAESIKNELKSYLPAFMLPSHIIIIDDFPLTVNGKIDRHNLPEPNELVSSNYVDAETDLEILMVEIWKTILGRKNISVTDNFFDLGGNSILIIKASRALGKVVDKEIKVSVFFEYPNIRDLARYIQSENTVYNEDDASDIALVESVNKFNIDPTEDE
jgi:amino acid adenylation domain-containing protein